MILAEPAFAAVADRVSAAAEDGLRVLLLAHSSEAIDADADGLPDDLGAVALVMLTDKIRPDARATLEYFAHQGVTLKVISGDNPATVAAVAARAGLAGAEVQRRDVRGVGLHEHAPLVHRGRREALDRARRRGRPGLVEGDDRRVAHAKRSVHHLRLESFLQHPRRPRLLAACTLALLAVRRRRRLGPCRPCPGPARRLYRGYAVAGIRFYSGRSAGGPLRLGYPVDDGPQAEGDDLSHGFDAVGLDFDFGRLLVIFCAAEYSHRQHGRRRGAIDFGARRSC